VRTGMQGRPSRLCHATERATGLDGEDAISRYLS
jgi:hypothetical protein